MKVALQGKLKGRNRKGEKIPRVRPAQDLERVLLQKTAQL